MTKIETTEVAPCAKQRAQLQAIVQTRVRELLVARHGSDIAERLHANMDKDPGHGGDWRVWIWAAAGVAFYHTRSEAMIAQADTEKSAILSRKPQTAGGRAFVRCHDLLLLLIIARAYRQGLLPKLF